MKRLLIVLFCFIALPSLSQRHCAAGNYLPDERLRDFMPGGKFFETGMKKLRISEEKSVTSDDDSIYYIPVVVHVLHYGEAEGSGRNLSNERVQSQIDILNQDYGKLSDSPGFNSHPSGVDTRIRFCLANRDPDGIPSNGIVRINTTEAEFDLGQNAQLKGYSFWDPERYLNIWVCKLSSNYIGYAQYPFISPSWADSLPMIDNFQDVQPDGVVIDYRVFGNVPENESGPYPSYNQGRTATHEIGHYLGLIHIWGDGFSCADNKTDYCSDTPPQATYTSGCPSSPGESCIQGIPSMIENYLDYSNDACMNIFTAEQKKRMRIVLRNCIRRKTVKSTGSSCTIATAKPADPVQPKIRLVRKFGSDGTILQIIPDNTEISEIALFDLYGRRLMDFPVEPKAASYTNEIKTGFLRPAVYFIRVRDKMGKLRLASFHQF